MNRTTASREPMTLLGELLTDGTDALAQLDVESLELLQVRAVQLEMEFGAEISLGAGSVRARAEVASRHRVFGEVLRSTRSHLNLLERMYGHGKVSPWDR